MPPGCGVPPDLVGLAVTESASTSIRQFNFANVGGLDAILFVQCQGGMDEGVVGHPAGVAFKEYLLIELLA